MLAYGFFWNEAAEGPEGPENSLLDLKSSLPGAIYLSLIASNVLIL